MYSFYTGLFWAFAYFALQQLLSLFNVPFDSVLVIAAELLYWTALFLHLRRKKLLTEYGIRLPELERTCSAVILLIIPIWQCILYGLPAASIREWMLLLLAAMAEEMAFRVLLPKLLTEQIHISAGTSAVLSSLVFALFHGVDLFSGVSLPVVLLQMLDAFCAGCAFCMMVKRTKSVLPPIILHTLINLTAGNQSADVLLSLVFSALLAGYAIYISHNTQEGTTYL